MTKERHEYLKAVVQDALWKAYKQTNEDIFKEVYTEWFDKYHEIDITVLEGGFIDE